MPRSPRPPVPGRASAGAVPAPRTAADDDRGSGRRLVALDTARGLALIGMIVVNVGPTEAEDLLHRLYLLPYGRASVLFVVIAGIGMGFLLRSLADHPRRRRVVLWRAGLLLVGGLALQMLTDDVSVILPVYGVLFALALLLHRLPRAALLGLAVAMTVVGPVTIVTHVSLEGGEHFTDPLRLGASLDGLVHGLAISGRYPLLTWCVPFLVGLWAARLDLRDRAVQRRMILWGGVAAVGGFAISQLTRSILEREADAGFDRLLTGAAHGQMPLWLVSSVGGALLVVAALLRLGHRARRLTAPLASAGRLALTLYVLHVLVLAVVVPPAGFSLPQGAAVSAVMVVTFVALAVLWERVADVGPLERLLRATWLREAPTDPATRPVRSTADRAPRHPTHPEGARTR